MTLLLRLRCGGEEPHGGWGTLRRVAYLVLLPSSLLIIVQDVVSQVILGPSKQTFGECTTAGMLQPGHQQCQHCPNGKRKRW